MGFSHLLHTRIRHHNMTVARRNRAINRIFACIIAYLATIAITERVTHVPSIFIFKNTELSTHNTTFSTHTYTPETSRLGTHSPGYLPAPTAFATWPRANHVFPTHLAIFIACLLVYWSVQKVVLFCPGCQNILIRAIAWQRARLNAHRQRRTWSHIPRIGRRIGSHSRIHAHTRTRAMVRQRHFFFVFS